MPCATRSLNLLIHERLQSLKLRYSDWLIQFTLLAQFRTDSELVNCFAQLSLLFLTLSLTHSSHTFTTN